MVRPFVKNGSGSGSGSGAGGSGGRRGRQGSDGAAPGPRQGGRPQPSGRAPEREGGRGPQNGRERERGPQGGRAGQGGVPGQRSARDVDRHQVPGLVSNPMPAPRAVARPVRQDLAPYPELDPPMSDLTTTMPILAVPPEDEFYDDQEYDNYDNPPPGEQGHFHDDGDWGRHRGSTRPPRALKAAGLLAGVVVAGVAAYSILGSGSSSPAAGPAAAGASSSSGAASGPDTPANSATSAAAPGAPTPTGTPPDSATDSTSGTKPSASHTTKTTAKTESPSSHPSSSSAGMAPRPSSSAPPPPSSSSSAPAAPPPSSSSTPTFTSLQMGSTGPAVTQLQQNLKSVGFGGWPMKVNGTFDSATQQAVRNFQDANPGTASADGYGVYGPATDKAMQQALS